MFRKFRDVTREAVLAARLLGWIAPWAPRVINLPKGKARSRPDALAPPKQLATVWPVREKALDWLRQQQILTPGQEVRLQYSSMLQAAAGSELVRQSMESRIRRALADSVEDEEGRAAWFDRVSEIVQITRHEAEAIQRTYNHRAVHEGLAEVMSTPAVRDEFPYFLWEGTDDGRERESHREFNGKVAHRDSPLAKKMQEHIRDWNCRCQMVPLSREDALARGIDDDTGWAAQEAEQAKVETTPPAPAPTPAPFIPPPSAPHPLVVGTKTPADDELVTIHEGVPGFDGQPGAEKIPKKPSAPKYRLVTKLGGSTGAEHVVDAEGKQFVRKFGASPAHVREEFAAEKLYRAAGVAVPESRLEKQDGKPVKLSEFISARPLGVLTGDARKAAQAEVRKHFVADALFGNRDVLGQDEDNILVTPDGKVHRVDVGGSLRFRAQGGDKEFGAFPDELMTLRNPDRSAARVFRSLTDQELVEQIDKLTGKRAKILSAAPKALRATLAKRIDYMDQIADVLRKPADASRARTGNDIQRIQDGTKVRKRIGSVSTSEGKALTQYTGDLYEDINNALRADPNRTTFPEPSIDLDDDALPLDKMNSELQKIITRGEELPKPVIVYRGRKNLAVADDMEKAMHVGKEVVWDGYASTSLDPTIASTFGPLIYEISITKGLDVASLQGFEGLNLAHKDRESEILVNHRSRYKVIGIKRNVPGRLIDDGRPMVTIVQMVQIND